MKLYVLDTGCETIQVIANSKDHAVELTKEQTGNDYGHMHWDEYEPGVVVGGW